MARGSGTLVLFLEQTLSLMDRRACSSTPREAVEESIIFPILGEAERSPASLFSLKM